MTPQTKPLPLRERQHHLSPEDYDRIGNQCRVEDYDIIERSVSHLPKALKAMMLDDFKQRSETQGREQALLHLVESSKELEVKPKENTESPAEKCFRECYEITRRFGLEGGIAYCKSENVRLPSAKKTSAKEKQLNDLEWWKKTLKLKAKLDQRKRKHLAGDMGYGLELYCSDDDLRDYYENQRQNVEYMANSQFISEEGDEINALDVVRKTTANPELRYIETMRRFGGIEQAADAEQWDCIFITGTLAGRYHRMIKVQIGTDKKGKPVYKKTAVKNPKWDDWHQQTGEALTPKDGQAKHVENNALIRARLAKESIEYAYYYVVEPHHDGTPHWHIAFFTAQENIARVKEIYREYYLGQYESASEQDRIDGLEKGADKKRVTFKMRNRKTGSAKSYMGKYLLKGIGGLSLEGLEDGEIDFESGLDFKDTALRVTVWKWAWGINQIGFSKVSPIEAFRELWRIKEPLENETAEAARQAAASNDFCTYIEIQGGLGAKVKDRAIHIHRVQPIDSETGEPSVNKYGDDLEKIKGIKGDEFGKIITREKDWILFNINSVFQALADKSPQKLTEAEEDELSFIVKKAASQKKLGRMAKAAGFIMFSAVDVPPNGAIATLGKGRTDRNQPKPATVF